MRLNKKQENALGIAIAVMSSYLSNGGGDENGEVDAATTELITMKEESEMSRLVEKRRREYKKIKI